MKRACLLVKNISLKKIINSFLLRLSYLYTLFSGTIKHLGMPEALSFETSAVCNLHCPECAVGMGILLRKNNFPEFKDFKKVIDELYPYLWHLFLYFQGEPFLNKNFFDYVKYATDKNIYVAVSTNGHFITEEIAYKMVDYGLNEIIISLDGMKQESYEKYRKGGNWQKVIESINILQKVKQEKKSKTPLVTIQFIVFSHNEHEISDFLSKKKRWGADYMELKTAQIYDLTNTSLLPNNEKYRRYNIVNGKAVLKNKQGKGCWRMWHSMVITTDGVVVPCCYDKNADYALGEIGKSSIRDIWKSEKYSKARKLAYNKHLSICSNCQS